jgi:16S rRNA processing protein RimM
VASTEPQWLAAGQVGRPHGLDGSFHVTRPRGTLLKLDTPVRIGGRETRIVRAAGTADRPIVRLEGHASREAAQALRGQELLVPRAAAPALGEDEWYAEDLEGCRVVDAGVVVGSVSRLLILPSCEALEVERPGGPDLLVPLVRDAVRTVDIRAGVIDVDMQFMGEEPDAVTAPDRGPRSSRPGKARLERESTPGARDSPGREASR